MLFLNKGVSDLLRTYRYRIYPNAAQRLFFAKTFGCVRFVYNKMLYDRKVAYEQFQDDGTRRKATTPASYKADFPFLKEVDSLALANAQLNLNTAYKNFFRDPAIGFPKYKSKKSKHRSYTTNNQHGTVAIINNKLTIPKLKSRIKIKQHRTFDGLIKSVTISQVPSGKYFIAVLVETDTMLTMPPVTQKIGLDVGLTDFCVASTGQRISNPKHFKQAERRLAKLQKDWSRKKKGSRNRDKARIKVAKLHERIANQRHDFLHKLSIQIIRENQAVVIEDLSIKRLLQDRLFAKAISGASWSLFRTLLTYKAEWYGRTLIVAPAYYASSQLCSACGDKNPVVKDTSVREWTCPSCGVWNDRDLNAAHNLRSLAG